ncbi:MAG: glycosyltransferase family 4 protein [Candidatus Omnitrophota bacterium]
MHILMVHPHDITSPHEPWTTRITNIAQEFIKQGHQVKLICFAYEDTHLSSRQQVNGYEVSMLSRKMGVINLFKNIVFIYKQAAGADIIHFQKCFWWAALPCLIAGWLLNKPVHYDWDDWELKIYYYGRKQSKILGAFLAIWERLILETADTISCSSKRLSDECRRIGIADKRLFEAHVGADIELFNPHISGLRVREKYNISSPLVLYLGQLHGGQYVELFIKAAKLVTMLEHKVMFMIIGEGYRRRELELLAERLGINNQIIFTGYIQHKVIPEHIAASDICVACFEDNAITQCKSPLKIAEYLAMGKPIGASCVGEVRRMVGGVGILVPPGDAWALSEGILRVLHDVSLRERMSLLSRERAELEYNWKVTANNLLCAYKNQ